MLLLSLLVAVIMADPTDKPVTRPTEETEATPELEDDHVIVLLEAFSGDIVAIRVKVLNVPAV
jgi:hypothetical protein